MPKGDGAVRRAAARDAREDAVEEKKFKKIESKKLVFGVNPLHVFFMLLFFLPTAFTLADYFFNFSKLPPGQGYGTLDPQQAVWRTKIRAFYEENNPGKINEIPDLLRKYKGKERKLWKKLQKKYAPKEDEEFEVNFD